MRSSTVSNIDLTADRCLLSDGRTLSYTTAGDPNGDPIIVHHGTPGSRLFAALLDDSAEDTGIRLVTPDRPGYGHSTPPPDEWGWTEWRSDVEELLDSESIETAGVLGFSGGGPFAISAGTSDRIAEIGLVSALIPPAEGMLASLARAPVVLRTMFRLSYGIARLLGPTAVVKQYTDRNVPNTITERVAANFHEAFQQGIGAVTRESRMAAMAAFNPKPSRTPIRAWHGRADENAPLRSLLTFAENTGCRVKAGNSDHLGTVLDYRREILEWFAKDRY